MFEKKDKIEIIKAQLQSCLATESAAYFTYGNIPRKRFQGAARKYAAGVAYESVIGLVDTTVMGNGERGIVFTLDGVYYRELLQSPGYCSYKDSKKFPQLNEIYFDNANLGKMLIALSHADLCNTKTKDRLNTVLNVAGTVLAGAVNILLEEQRKKYADEETDGYQGKNIIEGEAVFVEE
ncbi:MAG: hypothetical protein LUH20_11290 [Lachnospiraceae bacterium]|nr:hypothetical protein [Lachnospiraceae bacterium]